MSADWQVGDLARSVGDCRYTKHGDGPIIPDGLIFIVTGVGVWWDDRPVLDFNYGGDPGPWCGGCFRKIRPDEHEACEPEFVTLLKRTKVRA